MFLKVTVLEIPWEFPVMMSIRRSLKTGTKDPRWIMNSFKDLFQELFWRFEENSFPREVSFRYRCIPAGIYQLKVNNRNTRTWCEICSKLRKRHSDIVLVSLLLTLIIFYDHILIVNFEHVLTCWYFFLRIGFCKTQILNY